MFWNVFLSVSLKHFRNFCQQISTFMIKKLPFHTTENLPKRFHSSSRIFFPRFPLTLHWCAFHTLRKARKTRWACSWKFPFKQKTSWLFSPGYNFTSSIYLNCVEKFQQRGKLHRIAYSETKHKCKSLC